MTHDEHPYTRLSSRYLWRSRWYNLRQDRLRSEDGDELTYTVVEKPGSVWIVPVTATGDLVLIDQYRYAIDQWCLEVPAGNIEPDMDPLEMAARELREEIGGVARDFVLVGEFFTMNGIGNETATVFLAIGVQIGTPHRESTEHIRLRQVPIDEALLMARSGQIKDGPSALAILLSEAEMRKHMQGHGS